MVDPVLEVDFEPELALDPVLEVEPDFEPVLELEAVFEPELEPELLLAVEPLPVFKDVFFVAKCQLVPSHLD